MPKQRSSPDIKMRSQLEKDLYKTNKDPYYREMAKNAQKAADKRNKARGRG